MHPVSRLSAAAVEDARYNPLTESRIAGLANVLPEKVMAIKRLAIRAGLNFPVGGSLLLIARK